MKAFPLTNVALPNSVELLKNVTVPVGVPNPDFTDAVKVTGCQKMDGFGVDVKVVVVALVPTCSIIPTSLPPPPTGSQANVMHSVATMSIRPSPLRSAAATGAADTEPLDTAPYP